MFLADVTCHESHQTPLDGFIAKSTINKIKTELLSGVRHQKSVLEELSWEDLHSSVRLFLNSEESSMFFVRTHLIIFFMLAEFTEVFLNSNNFFITFTNKDWNVVVAVVVSTTFNFTLLQVPVIKSFNIRTNYRTSRSFTWNNKTKKSR